ncbi:MAG: hypothetical protein WAV28_02310 [Sedimentisphaerales bacterium]|jgi:hypothetical protein
MIFPSPLLGGKISLVEQKSMVRPQELCAVCDDIFRRDFLDEHFVHRA